MNWPERLQVLVLGPDRVPPYHPLGSNIACPAVPRVLKVDVLGQLSDAVLVARCRVPRLLLLERHSQVLPLIVAEDLQVRLVYFPRVGASASRRD